MNALSLEVIDLLNDDFVTHGQIAHGVAQDASSNSATMSGIREVLFELLQTGTVEIGNTYAKGQSYVEFVAWKGSLEEKVARAIQAVAAASGHDKEFAYWLCLRENVDRFED
jgi:hypothetical protein